MFGEHHDIPHEFPEFKDDIEALCSADTGFLKIYKEYHQLDDEIRHIEQNLETVSDFYAETLKKKRVLLKDEIYQLLARNRAAAK